MIVDADGCELREGSTMWLPIRWGMMSRHSRESAQAAIRCRLTKGVVMRDPDDQETLPHFHEIAFEVEQ